MFGLLGRIALALRVFDVIKLMVGFEWFSMAVKSGVSKIVEACYVSLTIQRFFKSNQ